MTWLDNHSFLSCVDVFH